MTEELRDRLIERLDVAVMGGGVAKRSAEALNADLIAEDTRPAVYVYLDRIYTTPEHVSVSTS